MDTRLCMALHASAWPKLNIFNSFQLSVAFHVETSHLFYYAKTIYLYYTDICLSFTYDFTLSLIFDVRFISGERLSESRRYTLIARLPSKTSQYIQRSSWAQPH